jgi:hypothetical protein
MKVRLFVTLFLAMISLCACSKQHEVKKQDASALVGVLQQAAIEAEKSQGIEPSLGATFIDCIEQVDLSASCQSYLQSMLVVVNKHHGYRNMTMGQLTSQVLYKKIHDPYVSAVIQSTQS